MKLATIALAIMIVKGDASALPMQTAGLTWNGKFYSCVEVRGWFRLLPNAVIERFMKYGGAETVQQGCECIDYKHPRCPARKKSSPVAG